MNKLTLLTLLVIAGVFASCSAPQSPQTRQKPFTYGIVTLDTDISYLCEASVSYMDGFAFDTDGVTKDTLSWPVGSRIVSNFNDGSFPLVAGTVSFDGTDLTAFPDSAYGITGQTIGLTGGTHIWDVQGSGTIPAFRDSVQGPFEPVGISSPSNAANVSESSDLTISWNSGNSAETTLLMIIPSSEGDGFSIEITGSTSSYTIPAASLSGIPKGKATISINRGVYKIGTASNGKNYIMVVWVNATRDINLQ